MTQRELEALSRAECVELLGTQVVGRLVFVDDDGPGAVPINYGLAGEEIVFRLEHGSRLLALLQPAVGFEVDEVDADAGSGWSVLVRGTAREVDLEQVPDLLRAMDGHFPSPWAEGIHNTWVAIRIREATGRRLTAPYYADLF